MEDLYTLHPPFSEEENKTHSEQNIDTHLQVDQACTFIQKVTHITICICVCVFWKYCVCMCVCSVSAMFSEKTRDCSAMALLVLLDAGKKF